MPLLKKPATWLSMLVVLFMQIPAQAAMVDTPDLLLQSERTQLVNILERKEVQQQLTDLGVDQKSAVQRVNQMTHEEIAELNGQIANLPAGAGVSTLELILIIILLVILL